jgi:hypothetical protein
MQPGEMNIDPIEAEFFSTEALGSLADALIREAIQNSLDARRPRTEAKIRIAFPTAEQMLTGGRKLRYLAGLWPHVSANRSGLERLPSPEAPLDYVLIEDYGTRGLQGNPAQSEDEALDSGSARNDFYYFWRNIGRSRKESGDLGRWGLGKTVFPAASRVNAFFGLTVRADDGRRLLMGQAVLRIHMLEGARYYPYGYFGRFQQDFALPLEDEEYLDEFCRSFRIGRGLEPGLSVVVPFADGELTPAAVLPSVVRHYFLPILAGDLVVEVAHDTKVDVLNRDSLSRLLERVGWDEGPQLQRVAELARWGLEERRERHVRLPTPSVSAAPRWGGDEASELLLTGSVKDAFNGGERLALQVPVWVKPLSGEAALASFDVYLERDDKLAAGEEHFVREGITVAGVRSGLQGGVRALVYVRDRTLSALLGDSENPAHTEWQERAPRLKARYRQGPFTLRYVKSAPREIVRVLTRPTAGRDFQLLQHLFSVEIPTEQTVRRLDKSSLQQPGLDAAPDMHDLEAVARDRFFQLQKLEGGFRVAGAGPGVAIPRYAGVRVAYEVRRGNPFALYQPLDFEMNRPPIEVHIAGGELLSQQLNIALLRIDEPGFQLTVRGFDPRRDVRVKVLGLSAETAE